MELHRIVIHYWLNIYLTIFCNRESSSREKLIWLKNRTAIFFSPGWKNYEVNTWWHLPPHFIVTYYGFHGRKVRHGNARKTVVLLTFYSASLSERGHTRGTCANIQLFYLFPQAAYTTNSFHYCLSQLLAPSHCCHGLHQTTDDREEQVWYRFIWISYLFGALHFQPSAHQDTPGPSLIFILLVLFCLSCLNAEWRVAVISFWWYILVSPKPCLPFRKVKVKGNRAAEYNTWCVLHLVNAKCQCHSALPMRVCVFVCVISAFHTQVLKNTNVNIRET